jgi:hypothetical protein
MNVSQVSKIWIDYHRAHSKHNTVRAHQFTIAKFNQNIWCIGSSLNSELNFGPYFLFTTIKALIPYPLN